jgi:DNA-binding MarR family transcriptional regulator
MQRILYLETKLRMRLITAEFEVLSFLYFNGPTKSRDLSLSTKSSIANFQLILRRLRESEVVVVEQDDADQRVRVYRLSSEIQREFSLIFDADAESRAVLAQIAGLHGKDRDDLPPCAKCGADDAQPKPRLVSVR